jgi:hypothetical protein
MQKKMKTSNNDRRYSVLVMCATGDECGADDAYQYGVDQLFQEEVGLSPIKDVNARWFDVQCVLFTYFTASDRDMAIVMLQSTLCSMLPGAEGPHRAVWTRSLSKRERQAYLDKIGASDG